MKPVIAIISNTSWYLWNFRLRLMFELQAAGFEVVAIAPLDEYSPRFASHQIGYVSWQLNRRSKNPLVEFDAFLRLYCLLRKVKPGLMLTFTPKANIYGALAARLLGVPIVNNVSGLGYAFIRKGALASLVKRLYRLAFARSSRVFFQNNDDLAMFEQEKIVAADRVERLPGSGVDIERFAPHERAVVNDRFVFLLVARMLWDKGIGEYVEAARYIRQKRSDVEFWLLGPLDAGNPAAIAASQLEKWSDEGVVIYQGSSDTVIDFLRQAYCVVLPTSYREGCPRSLLEAASMAIPVITTDTPGCRDVVEDGVTGYLCRLRDAHDLKRKMEQVLSMSDEQRRNMGRRGRDKMIRQFDERIVIDRYLTVVREILGQESVGLFSVM